jgi:hypothetical protein
MRRAQVNGWGQLIVARSTGAVLLTDDPRNPSQGCCPCFSCQVLETAAAAGRLKYEFSGAFDSPGPPGAFQVGFPIVGSTYPDRVKPGVIANGGHVIMQKLSGATVIDEFNLGPISYQCCRPFMLYGELLTPVAPCVGDFTERFVTKPFLVSAQAGSGAFKFLFGEGVSVVRGAYASSGQAEWLLPHTGQFTSSLGDSRIRAGQLCRMFIE